MIEPLRLSLQLATASSLILLALGVPLAWVLARRRFLGRRLLETVLLLPLTLPPTVLGFYLLQLLGAHGPLAAITGLTWAFSFPGLLVGSVLFSLPFALTAFREAFFALDEDWLAVASVFGATRWQRWRMVILPLTWPSLLSGVILAFAHTLGEFGVVLMLGGNIPGRTQVVSTYLYDLVQSLDLGGANRAALTLLVTSFVLVYTARWCEEWGRARLQSGRA